MSSVTSGGSSSESNAASSGGSWNMNTTWTSMPDSGKSSSGAKDESITCNETPKATSWAQAVSGECSSSSASTSAKCDLQPSVSSSSASNSNAALQVSAPSSNNNGNIQSHGCSRPSSAHSDSSAVRPVESLPDDELSESNNLNVSKLFQPSQQEFDQLIQTDLYSRDWGRSVINHETSWEGAAPKSKASDSCGNPSSSSGGPAVSGAWKAQVSNSGTELWESTLRQGKSGNTSTPPTKTSAPQWTGHTPANHIGGTWGEEEEDNGNMWTGVPGPNKESGSNSSMRSACNPPGSVIPDSVAMPNQKPWLQDEAARPNWNVENEPPTQPKWGKA